jgi:nucleoid-associated protein YgaU
MISSLKQTFVLFDQTGVPLRATLDVTFVEFLNRNDDAKVTAPGAKQATARLGDSLPTISFDAFGDPTLWRTIADANAIEDPFALAVGSVLTLPKL